MTKKKKTKKKVRTKPDERQQNLACRVQRPLFKISKLMEEILLMMFQPPDSFEYDVSLDLFENDGYLIMEAVLPGMEPDDIKLKVSSGVLTIKGEVLESEDFNEDGAFIIERVYGTFSRALALPMHVDPYSTEAFYRDGILRVEMPVDEDNETPAIRIDIYYAG